jgi:hypothetical protein
MTTTAMVFGMLPVAFGKGDGAEFRAPMGIISIGGMASSTLLTLLVVPVVYTLIDDAQQWAEARMRALRLRFGAHQSALQEERVGRSEPEPAAPSAALPREGAPARGFRPSPQAQVPR